MFFAAIKEIAIAAAIAFVFGLGTGYYTAHRFDQTTAYKLQIDQLKANELVLKENVKTMEAALAADAAKSQEDDAAIVELKRKADDLQAQISSGVALPAADTKRLLEWWDRTHPKTKPSRSSR